MINTNDIERIALAKELANALAKALKSNLPSPYKLELSHYTAEVLYQALIDYAQMKEKMRRVS